MKIAFMGTPEFAVPTLQALIRGPHEVVAVVAQPSRPAGRGQQLVDPPTVILARAHGLPVLQPKAVRQGPFPGRWRELGADIGVVAAYGRILTADLLGAPRLGCLNVHGSLLPRYRGAAPIQWAVTRGEAVTGITIMRMDEGLDTGDMLASASTPIGPDETADEVCQRLALIGAQLLLETLDRLDEIEPFPQDHSQHTLAPPLTREDGRIRWDRTASEIHCLVRGMTPWPGAWAMFREQVVRIHQVRPIFDDGGGSVPGTVIRARGALVVATGGGAIELVGVQCPNRKRQTGCELVNGSRVQVGEIYT